MATDKEPREGMPSRKHTPFGPCPVPEQAVMFVCQVVAPGDGDTCTVMLELPCRMTWTVTLRYQHCFAPERDEEGGPATASYNASLIAGRWGTVITKGRLDQRSRLVGDLYLWTGKGVQMLDVSKLVQAFVTENGYGKGNS